MKNRLYLGACVFLLLMQGMAVCNAQNKDFANLKRYAESNRVLQQEQSGTVKGRVVFMGNSITEGWVRTDGRFFEENGYVGRGISGQTSYQFLLRFREDVIKLKPEVVVINAGTNDVAENTGPYVEEYTFGNIVSMVELARANDIKVVLTSVLPAAAFGWNKTITDAPQKIAALNKRIAAYAAEQGLPYVDYYHALLADDGHSLDAAYSKDGVHPTLEGYRVMEPLVKKVVAEVLGNGSGK